MFLFLKCAVSDFNYLLRADRGPPGNYFFGNTTDRLVLK
jgi:hypothetical protein